MPLHFRTNSAAANETTSGSSIGIADQRLMATTSADRSAERRGRYHLSKVGTCNVIVRDEARKSSFTSAVRTLPGTVLPTVEGLFGTAGSPAGPSAAQVRAANEALRRAYVGGTCEKFAVFCRKSRRVTGQMRVFVGKLRQATRAEAAFMRQLSSSKKNEAATANSDDSASGGDSSSGDEEEDERSFLFPAKLGKVHVELQQHMRSWELVLGLWNEHR